MKNIVISTGAGISAESGVPTFRDAHGLWTKYNPDEVSHVAGWVDDPERLLDFKNELRREFVKLNPQPNAAHLALTRLQKEWKHGKVSIITQNVDGLHTKAGSDVLEMHGTIAKKFCEKCKDVTDYDSDIIHADECSKCGEIGSIRPCTVLFGEVPHHLLEIEELLMNCRVFAAIGTSLQVRPASTFAAIASNYNAETWIINKEAPFMTLDYGHAMYGDATVEVPRWVDFMLEQSTV